MKQHKAISGSLDAAVLYLQHLDRILKQHYGNDHSHRQALATLEALRGLRYAISGHCLAEYDEGWRTYRNSGAGQVQVADGSLILKEVA